MKEISIIVAIADNNAIGKDNQLLWHLSEDLRRFKRLTTGHTVVMGKKTFESLPFRPLKNRRNIVLSDARGEEINGCEMAYSIEEAMDMMDEGKENFIIGGGSVYSFCHSPHGSILRGSDTLSKRILFSLRSIFRNGILSKSRKTHLMIRIHIHLIF